MKKRKDLNLLTDPINSLIINLSIPVMLSGLLRTSYNFIDMLFASRLGGVQVASVAFVGPLFRLVQALGMGLTMGGLSLIAKKIGAGKRGSASNYAEQLRMIILLLAFTVSIVGVFLTGSILRVLGVSGELLQKSSIYTQIRFLSIPFTLIFQYYLALYKSQGKMNITLQMSVLGLVGNTVLNAFFIFVLKMGISGLAYGTIITQVIQAIVVYFWYHRSTHDFKLSRWPFKRRFCSQAWSALLKTGLPLSFSQASTFFGFLLTNTFIVHYGYQVVAAFAIGNQINSIFFSQTVGIGQGLLPLVAQNYGANAMDRLKRCIKRGMLFATSYSFIGLGMIFLLIKPLGILLSKGDMEIYNHTKNYLYICSWTIIPFGVFHALSGIFNGFQRTRETMTINVIRLWGVRIPLLLLFRYIITSPAEYGVWWTMFISNYITAIAAIILFFVLIPKKLSSTIQ